MSLAGLAVGVSLISFTGISAGRLIGEGLRQCSASRIEDGLWSLGAGASW